MLEIIAISSIFYLAKRYDIRQTKSSDLGYILLAAGSKTKRRNSGAEFVELEFDVRRAVAGVFIELLRKVRAP